MRKYIVAVSLLFILPTFLFAQWTNSLGAGDAGSRGAMHSVPMSRVPMPRVTSTPPFLKGAMPLSETWDPTIAGYGNNPDGMWVDCFAEDSEHLYIGGDFRTFDSVVAGHIVEYDKKTGQWSSLDTGFDNDITALAIHNGKLYAAGDFDQNYFGGNYFNYIAVWDGTSWHDLGGGMSGYVDALAFVGDTLYAGGGFLQAGGVTAYHLAYWDGQRWQEAFGGTSAPVSSLLAVHDSLFVGGTFNYVGGHTPQTSILVNGSAMLRNGTWNPMGSGFRASTFAMYHDTLWAGGGYFGIGNDKEVLYCLSYWNGSDWQGVQVDTNLGTNGTGGVYGMCALGDTLLALGDFSSIGGAQASGIAMYSKGSWSPFGGGLYGYGYAAIPFNGRIYVGGQFTKAGSIDAMGIASISNGNWTPLAQLKYQNVGWQSDLVRAIVTTSHYVFIGGNFETIAGTVCNHIAAYDKQQGTWANLGAGVDGYVYSLAVQGNNLVVGGDFNYAGSIPAEHIATYNISTGDWSALGSGVIRPPLAIATDGSSIYAAAYNPLINGTFYDILGRWDGSKWNSFGNGLRSGSIYALTWQGSTLYAGGAFRRTDDGTVVDGIAEIQQGASWAPLNTGLGGFGGYAVALAVSGDSLYVGGEFTQADGMTDTSLAVWNNTTQTWNPIGAAGFDGPVFALAADGAGGVYAGGNFSEVAQAGRGNLVRWNGSKFGTVGSGVNDEVDALGIDNTALYAGGWFQRAGSSNTVSLHFGTLDGAGAGVNTPAQDNPVSLSIFPNPASAASSVTFDLAKPADVRIELFNAIGSRVALIADSYYNVGQFSISFDASKLSSGMYFLRLTSGGVVSSRSFVVEQQ